jgi:hypothetical protein
MCNAANGTTARPDLTVHETAPGKTGAEPQPRADDSTASHRASNEGNSRAKLKADLDERAQSQNANQIKR